MELEPFVFRHEGHLLGARAWQEGGESSPEAGAATLGEVNQFALRPLLPDEFAVFTLDLCNNQIDRHFSRFPEEELVKINGMTPGRPLMERHDLRGTLPRGTFFRSELYHDGEVVSVRPDVYVLRTHENEDFILNIEGGVYRDTSIGFSFRMPECSVCGRDLRTCDHVPGRSYGDVLCYYIMRDVIEVIEGSVVPSGSQGTAFVGTTACKGCPAPKGLPAALEVARETYHRPVELWEPALSAETVRDVREAIKASEVSVDRVGDLIRDGVTARRRAIERLCGLGRELDGGTFDEGIWQKALDPLSLDEIHGQLRAFEVRFDQKYPPAPVSRPEKLGDKEGASDRGGAERTEAALAIVKDEG